MKIKEFLIEAEEEEKSEADGLTQKIVILANVLNKKEDVPKFKRTLRKALEGKMVTDEERELLKIILQLFFSPDVPKFKRLLKRLK